MQFSALDPVSILNFGVVGLGFLLVLFSFWLLIAKSVTKEKFPLIYAFMAFSFAVICLGLVSEYFKNMSEASKADAEQRFSALLTRDDALRQQYFDLKTSYTAQIASEQKRLDLIQEDVISALNSATVSKDNAAGAVSNYSDVHGCVDAAGRAEAAANDAMGRLNDIKGKIVAFKVK